MIAVFRFAEIKNLLSEDVIKFKLLHEVIKLVNYPQGDIIENAIRNYLNFSQPANKIEKVAWDAMNSSLALNNLIVQLPFLKEEMNRLNGF